MEDQQETDKKNDDHHAGKPSAADQKSVEAKAKELYAFVVEMSKNVDKRHMLLIKQKIEAKAKEFFRCLMNVIEFKITPALLKARRDSKAKARAFAAYCVEIWSQMTKENLLITKDKAHSGSKNFMFTAMKIMKNPEARSAMVQRHGRVGATVFGLLMMMTIAFRNNDGSGYPSGAMRGRHLSAEDIPRARLIQRSEHSLHPKWRFWHDMTEDQQQSALEELSPYFQRYGSLIGFQWSKQHLKEEEMCHIVPNWGKDFCDFQPGKSCSFLSFNSFDDVALDESVSKRFKCKGFVVNTNSESQASKPIPNLTYQNLGLTSLRDERNGHNAWNTTVPETRQFLRLDYSDLLKLDCLGCEVAFTKDILAEDPTFLDNFGQFNVKMHASKAFVQTEEELYYFGLMFPLLEESGMELVSSKSMGCKKKFEDEGCMNEMTEWGYPCGKGPGQKKPKSCQELLFARDDIARFTTAKK